LKNNEIFYIISIMEWKNSIIHGDLFDQISTLPDASINAVVTSPPYANQRVKQYGGISEEDYPEWTVRWMEALRSKLTADGNIAIVIRPHVDDGILSDYVLRTRLAVRQSWCEIEELIWTKPTSPPMGHIGRPRRSWESILWFSATNEPFCDTKPDGIACGTTRIGLESKKAIAGKYIHGESKVTRGVARVRDYVEASVHTVNRDDGNTHPAQYPEKLADWVIRILCPVDGCVFDPFAGSGSTLVAAKKARRNYCGTEIVGEYVDIANKRLADIPDPYPEFFDFSKKGVPKDSP
jgi:site-specific DNA-methyltransferase (adenine-specific)